MAVPAVRGSTLWKCPARTRHVPSVTSALLSVYSTERRPALSVWMPEMWKWGPEMPVSQDSATRILEAVLAKTAPCVAVVMFEKAVCTTETMDSFHASSAESSKPWNAQSACGQRGVARAARTGREAPARLRSYESAAYRRTGAGVAGRAWLGGMQLVAMHSNERRRTLHKHLCHVGHVHDGVGGAVERRGGRRGRHILNRDAREPQYVRHFRKPQRQGALTTPSRRSANVEVIEPEGTRLLAPPEDAV